MPEDPLEAFRKIQKQLESLRKAQRVPPNLNVSSPGLNVSYTFKTGGIPTGPAPAVPDPLVDWLLEDLPPRAFHELATETLAQSKAKGFRPGHLPRPEGLKLMKKRYERESIFRSRIAQVWLKGRGKEDQAFRLLKITDVRRNPWPLVEKFGFPLAFWLMMFSMNGQLRAVALQVLKEAVSKEGKLEDILAAAAKNVPPVKEWVSLPDVSHGDEIARVQAEVEQILEERDLWQRTGQDEKEKRERAEAGVKSLREENQRLSQAKTASDKDRLALQTKVSELEMHLRKLHDAEAVIKRLEKNLKETEHESARLRSEKQELAAGQAQLEQTQAEMKIRVGEMETTLRYLTALIRPPATAAKPVREGQVLFLITNAEPGPYFEAAKQAGFTLLVHRGQNRDAQFDKSLNQAWRVLVLGDLDEFWKGLLPALRTSAKPFVLLPTLGPEIFERSLPL